MSQYTSYYLYQKYEKRGDQPWLPSYPNVYSVDGDGTMPLVVKQEDDPSCGYIPPPTPTYRWIDLDPSTDWICSSCDVKASGTYESGQTFTIDCNGSTTLESGDTTSFTGLEYIRIGDCVTSIGTNALQARPNLVGVTIPPSVTSIGNRAFFNDAGLEDCAIPQSVTSIGSEAFRNCISLRNVMLWDSITSIGASAFTNCDFIIDINIPTGLTSISSSCFRDCGALSEVTIPPTITSIGDNAFNGCTGLFSITCLAQTPPTLGESAFTNTNDCAIYIPCDSYNDYSNAWSDFANRLVAIPPCEVSGKFVALYTNGNQYVVPCNDNPTLTGNETQGYPVVSSEYMLSADIGDCVTAIAMGAFQSCSGLTSVTIPNSVTSIGEYAFRYCRNLTGVTIPSGVTTINDMTFLGCRSLTNVTIPSGVTYIGEYAFQNCSGLTSITVDAETPPTIPYDGKPFDNTNDCPIYVPCYSVSQYKNTSGWSRYSSRIERNPNCQPPADTKWVAVYTGGTVETAPCDFSGTITSGEIELTDLSEIEVQSCVSAISESAFSGCTTLSAVTVPNTLTTMMGNAFNGCSSLTSIFIPSGIDIVNFTATQGGFKNCSSLTSVTVDSNSIISANMSYSTGICTYCFGSQVKECIIGENVTAIGYRAFYRSANLTSVTIPNTVTIIRGQAFGYCSGLTEVIIPNSVTSIYEKAFISCYGLIDITLGSGLTTIGESSFAGCRNLTGITIPDSVTTISGSAFQNCSGLTTATIGSGVTKIGDNAFWKCSGLTSITINATTPPTLGGTSVFDDTNNCPIYVPAQSLTDYQNTTRWAEYSSRMVAIT